MGKAPQRLRHRHEFLRVARGGQKCVMPGLVLQVYEPQSPDPKKSPENIRIGFTVSKKVGNSVTRNRARRRLRAAANIVIQKYAVGGHDYVMVGRTLTTKRDFEALVGDLEKGLQRLGKWQKGIGDRDEERLES